MKNNFVYIIFVLMLTSLPACSDDKKVSSQSGDKAVQAVPSISADTGADVVNADMQRKPYFGDLHVHTAYSLDAYITFVRPGPRAAYRFAQGEAIDFYGNKPKRLRVPLDFAAVTDHAEFLGEVDICLDKSMPAYDNQICADIRNEQEDPATEHRLFTNVLARIFFSPSSERMPICGENGRDCLDRSRTVWQSLQTIANEFYQPGKFTTFIAYEWTSNFSGNRHRNVIFRNTNVPATAWSKIDAPTPEILWSKLQTECQSPCEVMTISHNSNDSKGHRFVPENYDGTALTEEQAATRISMEPLIEIMQHKGDSECRLGFATTDESCNFENVDPRPVCSSTDPGQSPDSCVHVCDATGKPEGCVWARNYVRNGLKEGLRLEQELGVNPFKLGFIGSTDAHNANAGDTNEEDFRGHHGYLDAKAEDRLLPKLKTGYIELGLNPGGLAGVWAEENTRDSIFAALKRRETFGTSGTRLVVRFFGGWDYPQTLGKQDDLVKIGYQNGVPMGGDLPPGKDGQSPRFMLWAMKGADGMKLQRVQIIKGWLQDGETKEQVYDAVCSDGLQPDAKTHRCPDNGARVDISDCSVTLDKGAVELVSVWQDPEFDARQRAFYYTRVLENPSCRWSTYEANRLGREPPAEVNPVVQERAWSSPIWYTPGQKESRF